MEFMMRRFLVFSLLVFIGFSCKSNDYEKEAEFEKREKQIQDSIDSMLKSVSGITIQFTPKDTLIALPNETYLNVNKKSFITTDSNLYSGKVFLTYNYSQDFSEAIAQHFIENKSSVENLKGIIKFEIKDEHGNPLKIDTNFRSFLIFPRNLKMTDWFYTYDSTTKEYSSPHFIYKKYKIPKSLVGKNGYEEPTIGFNAEFFSPDSVDWKAEKKVKYRGSKMSRQEVVGYELTIKQSGFYYLNRKDANENAKGTKIQVNTIIKDSGNFPWQKVKVFIYTQNQEYNYFLSSKHRGNGIFDITSEWKNTQISLPLNYKYTLFAYCIDGENIYSYKQKNISLQPQNNIQIELKKVKFNKLIKQIQTL